MIPTSQPRRTSQLPLARGNPLSPGEMPPTSQPRTPTQQGRVCRDPRAEALLALYTDWLTVQFAPKTVQGYQAVLRVYVTWLEARGQALTRVTSADLVAYQRDRVGGAEAGWPAVLG